MNNVPSKIAYLVRFLEEAFPTFRSTSETAVAWTQILGEYSDEQLAHAAKLLARHHRHGAPSTSHVVEAIEGRIERIPVYATDVWARVILRGNGEPSVKYWEERRVPYGETLGSLPIECVQGALMPRAETKAVSTAPNTRSKQQ